ncbi:DUF6266 family protein [Pedobacter gandavensis]|uniref:DUF6266 family protein n=1 Tax=Pedobacter gandavensis TaxID=2679963 RepID=UPI0029313ED8|nr:DUF6266 family protein [Pedobacter gandavensis]
MAVLKKGPHGWSTGKLGDVVSYMLRGQYVQRTIGKPGKPSLKQQENHQKMAVTTHFLRNLKDYLNNGFDLEARGTVRNQHNLAVSHIKKNALKGTYPNISIDYAKVQLSKGNLAIPKDLRMEKKEGGLQISWNSLKYDGEGAQYDDCLQLAICFPKTGRKKLELNFSKREQGTAFLELQPEQLEQSMEVYLFLRASNHDSVSDTIYLGNLNGSYENPKIKALKEKEEPEELKLKSRLEQISAKYHAQLKLDRRERMPDKSFRSLEKEYQVLAENWRLRQEKPG